MEQEYRYMVCTSCMTYNHAPYIVDAMNGFTMQETTFPVYYLITDDASTDGEPEVIKQYLADHFQSPYRTEETDDYYLICANHNTNPNCNFIVFFLKYNHYSIKKSKLPYQSEWRDTAKYIAYCEGDDYWIDSKKLQMQVDYMEANPKVSLCFTNVKDFHQADNRFGKSVQADYDNANLPQNRDELFYYILLGKCRIQTCTVVYRNSILKLIKNNDTAFMMGDTTLWLDLSQYGSVYYLSQITGVYRIVCGSASRNPQTLVRFRLSMFEMRVYYCKKYGYLVPDVIKRKYNRSLVDCIMQIDFVESNAYYPLFPMNFIQSGVFYWAKTNKLFKNVIHIIWKFENLISSIC